MDYRKMYVHLENDGVSDEEIKKYKRFLDCEKKRCKRDRIAKKKAGIVFNSLEALVSDEENREYEIPDNSQDALEKIIHNDDLVLLRKCIRKLSQEDQHLLWTYFDTEDEVAAQAAKALGMPVSTFKDRKNRALQKLREEFLKESGE